MLTWVAVLREIKPVGSSDLAILRRSAIRGFARSATTLDVWQDPELIEDADVRIPGVGRFHLRAFTDDLYHVLPSREAKVVSTIRERLKPGSVFVDAGANIGFFTLLAARLVGPAGQVFAIEMMPDTASRLREHIATNDVRNVTVLEFALSDRSGDAILATVPQGKHGQASIVRSATTRAMKQVGVSTRTLDDLLPASGRVDLMKMDLESAELLALRGAGRVLGQTRAIIVEQLGDDDAAIQLLRASGFDTIDLDGSNVLATRDQLSAEGQ
jgi:FkbM family methyltransferase